MLSDRAFVCWVGHVFILQTREASLLFIQETDQRVKIKNDDDVLVRVLPGIMSI